MQMVQALQDLVTEYEAYCGWGTTSNARASATTVASAIVSVTFGLRSLPCPRL